MAEPRGDKGGKKILSFATKKARRVQQKMLQKVGQAERTTDDNYTEFVVNFNKQQLAASRLQKELTKYANSLKVVSVNTKNLMDLWLELYEPEWKGHSEFESIMESKMLLWEDILKKIQDDLMEPLLLYMSKFPETKKLVEKRERKIVDHDYAKRELEAARQNRKMTEVKLQQVEEAYHEAKATFDEVTDNLYEELPALFDSRIEFYASLFRNMSGIELKFHEEMAKLDSTYHETMNQLHGEAETGIHTSKKERILSSETNLSNFNPVKGSVGDDNSISDDEGESETESTKGGGDLSRTSSEKGTPTMQQHSTSKPPKPLRSDSTMTDTSIPSQDTTQEDNVENGSITPIDKQPPPKPAKPPSVSSEQEDSKVEEKKEEEEEEERIEEDAVPSKEVEEDVTEEKKDPPELEEEPPKQKEDTKESEEQIHQGNDEQSQPPPSSASTLGDIAVDPDKETNESMGVLFKVVALHPYTGEDEDELSFDKGDIICVVPYEDPEDEEDGWKMGFVQGTTKKGIFPENFTKPFSD